MTLTDLLSLNERVVGQVDDPACADEYAAIFQAYERAGGSAASLYLPTIASLIISGHRVLRMHNLPGISLLAEEMANGVHVRLVVRPHVHLEQPILLCFGMLPSTGVQQIFADYAIGAGACVALQTHSTFPYADQIYYRMETNIRVDAHATLTYNQVHYHGQHGGIRAIPQALVQVAEGGHYLSTFRLVNGRIGQVDLDHQVTVAARASAAVTTVAYGTGNDDIHIRAGVHLNGEQASGFINNQIAVCDQAQSRVCAVAIGNAAGTRGHIDCTEIVRDAAIAESDPRVVARHNQARLTQTSNVGAISEQHLATLLAQGMDQTTAVDTIIRSMLH